MGTQERKPLVSIFCLAYNHRDYIVRALEGMLMQKTDFDFEIIIGEDNSTDGTREIVFDYANKYPDKISVITSENNVGMRANAARTREACKGKYIAFCEGDDYWTHPRKLQIQADFLESNPDFSICFHNAIILWEDKSRPPEYFCPKDQKEISSTEDVIRKYFIATASMLVRSEYHLNFPDWFKEVYNGDWGTQLILSTKGKIKYLEEPMSVYRKNLGGLSGTAGDRREYITGKMVELLTNFNAYSDYEFDATIQEKIRSLHKELNDARLKKKSRILYWMIRPNKFKKKLLK
jgi:glycosyltransferase involved in cell wall biosynthesis